MAVVFGSTGGMKLKHEYPRSVDWKGVKGTIHTHFNQAKKLQRFQFHHFDNGRPKVVSRSNDEDEIEEVALDILKQLGNGKTDLLTLSEKQRSMVSVLIQEAIDKRLVRAADPTNKSKKFAAYVPFWA